MRKRTAEQRQRKITRMDLVDLVSEQTGHSQQHTKSILDAAITIVIGSLRAGIPVGITNLGTWRVTPTRPKRGVRPGTRESITIPAGHKVSFKVASSLRPSFQRAPDKPPK